MAGVSQNKQYLEARRSSTSWIPRPPNTRNTRLQALRYLAPIFLMLAYWAGNSGVSICFFYSITGLPCPGCGMTRSVHFLIHGDLIHSLKYHPLGFVTLGICLLVVATLFSIKATQIYEFLESAALKFATPALILILLFAVFRGIVVYSAGSEAFESSTELSSLSGLFASFDEPGLLDFLSGSLFKMGSF
ncbi:MAG: DUF2752 domain-containing protein [Leptospiraceae bacterium]